MDQSPTTTGGTDANTVQTGPDQNTLITSETPAPAHEVDSHYVDRDVKLPRDKKGHKGAIIAGIIIGILLCAVAGLLIWFFVCYNNPDKVALDAVENFFKADNVVMEGTVTLTSNDEDSSLQSATIFFDSSSTSLPNSSNVIISFQFDDDRKISLKVGTVQMRDGVVYLQIGQIMESIDQLDIDESTREEMSAVFDVLEVIDNEWWRISVPEIVDELDLQNDIADAAKDIYSCVIDRANGQISPELAQVYNSHRFLKVTPAANYPSGQTPASWHNLYSVTLDNTELANFINALPETESAKEFYACYNRAIGANGDTSGKSLNDEYGLEPISADDFVEISADDIDVFDDVSLYLEVSQFGHQLSRINVFYDEDGAELTGSVAFTYQSVTVAEPESYRPITELFEELGNLMGEIWGAYDEYYYDDEPEWGDDSSHQVYCADGTVVTDIHTCPEWATEI